MEPSPSYSTSGFAGFYERFVASLPPEFEVGQDVCRVYAPLLEEAVRLAAARDGVLPLVVLDLFTGSGRVALGLLQHLRHSEQLRAAVSSVRLVGLDSSEEMLAAARAAAVAAPASWELAWRCADAGRLSRALLAEAGVLGACRLVVCSAGSFHHLLTAAQQIACLRGVAAALAPSGPAYAVLNIFHPDHLQASPGEAAVVGPYRRTCVEQRREQQADGGVVWRQRFELELYADDPAAAAADPRHLLWRRSEAWALREVSAEEVRRLVQRAGLRIVRQQRRWADGWSGCGDNAPSCDDDEARIFVLSLRHP
jgi:SAM-dependent methyltransferase